MQRKIRCIYDKQGDIYIVRIVQLTHRRNDFTPDGDTFKASGMELRSLEGCCAHVYNNEREKYVGLPGDPRDQLTEGDFTLMVREDTFHKMQNSITMYNQTYSRNSKVDPEDCFEQQPIERNDAFFFWREDGLLSTDWRWSNA